MSVSIPRCQPITQPSGNRLEQFPQFPVKNGELYEIVPDMECPLLKKPRMCEVISPDGTMPLGLNKAMNGNFKTKLCIKFVMGQCSYGEKCLFAHGIGEVRKPLPKLQGVLVGESRVLTGHWNDAYRMVDELKICRRFYNGEKCNYGDKCRFLHANPAGVRYGYSQFRERSIVGVDNAGGSSGDHRTGFINSGIIGGRVDVKAVVPKTKPCNNWMVTGSCRYGKMCRFAHDQTELQNLNRHIAMKSGFVPSIASRSFPHAKDVIEIGCNQQVNGMKCKFKHKQLEKINGIYADWIEDMPPMHSSLDKVES